ncbi:MAG: class I SAM-dependent DNA methyltransferase [Bacteroidetes bacterium]|nr:class I SAM-dependent DNA methyltransferase [Bacteroidota bacterium]
MPLSLNEIRTRAAVFASEWADAYDEDAEAKSFWDGFFRVFGQERRQVAMFEKFVKKLNDKQGYIDLFWPGKLVVEHKSKGKNLDRAYDQAADYFTGLKAAEYPRYIIVSDFARMRLYDLDHDSSHEIMLAELPEKVDLFKFIAGYEQTQYKEQDPANIEAAELMGKLHDAMLATGYEGHALEVYLVRLLFCLFAEDSNIFEKYQFQSYIEDRTATDGSDLGSKLAELFYVLNTDPAKRLTNLDEQLNAFAYVNGKLFEETLPPAAFDRKMREQLLECCSLDWSRISPAIFGSLFQSVMDKEKRRNLGAHYTSEKNILKLIKPLFLDELWAEFEAIKAYKNKGQRSSAMNKFHDKISELRFLDPACGCGNFLIVSYRELRLLELEVIKQQLNDQFSIKDGNSAGYANVPVSNFIRCDVAQFYGIEIEEFPSQIAQVALWLMDHQMNLRVSDMFGQYFARLPLRSRPRIVHANALRTDWQSLIDPIPWQKREQVFDYIMGNPPFLGHQWRNEEQQNDMHFVFNDSKRAGRLDFVAAWYRKAAQYINLYGLTKVGFVSTNSIVQGEQVPIMYSDVFNKYKCHIYFAHQTFKWSNEARGNAAVHVVIIGFTALRTESSRLFIYDSINNNPIEIPTSNINSYLVASNDILLSSRSKPLHGLPEMFKGSQPTDGGHLILEKDDYDFISQTEPELIPFIKKYIGAYEFINNKYRYCFWLKEAPSELLLKNGVLKERLKKVTEFRNSSPTASVRRYSKLPSLFTQDRQPISEYLAVPEVSSENRDYIPIGYLSKDVICSNKLQIIPGANVFIFGVLQSKMHVRWAYTVGGKMKSDFSYSPSVYYNFPWPENPTDAQKKAVEEAAQGVLDTRAKYPGSSLATLYNPLTMPPDLLKAHQTLDKAVDKCYRKEPFADERERIEYLFGLYEKYTSGLLAKATKSMLRQSK